jgi:hypothetical protein
LFAKNLDMVHLERLLRETIISGQSRTHRPWRKILIIAEGVYRLVEIRKKKIIVSTIEGLCRRVFNPLDLLSISE